MAGAWGARSVVVGLSGGDFTITIAGSQSLTVPVQALKDLHSGRVQDVGILLYQMMVALRAAGINPATATAAQVKTAIEAQTYNWWM